MYKIDYSVGRTRDASVRPLRAGGDLYYLAAGVVTLTLVAVAWRFGFALSA